MNFLKSENIKKTLHKVWIPIVLVFVFVGVILVGMVAYAKTYENRVLPGVYIGDISIGGMERSELAEYLHSMTEKLSNNGLHFYFDNEGKKEEFIIYPTIVTDDNIIDVVSIDIDKEVERLLAYQKQGNILARAWRTGLSRITASHLKLENITLDKKRVFASLEEQVTPFETKTKNAGVDITSTAPLTFTLTSSTPGFEFDYSSVEEHVLAAWAELRISDIELVPEIIDPDITKSDLEDVVVRIDDVVGAGKFDISYTDTHTKRDYLWSILPSQIADWLEPQEVEDNGIGFGLDREKVEEFLGKGIAKIVNKEAKNAKFSVGDSGRVSEFQGSRPGVTIDVDKTYSAINEGILQRTWHDEGLPLEVALVTMQVEPEIKTGEVNDLGISEILGVGYSNFSGSPGNRIKNIRFAVEHKLNGLLIKPDEDFSLLKALEPFTIEGGYLPELVIKGDEIKPEVAGGLCQVGSTMFRAAMNSGMPITQRRNHSLVVSYYNDHRNGMPGTDATIYDPAPDFRFKNDTGNYMLLTTDMNVRTGDMYFTLWGTNDGRKGSYSEPKVSKWIPTEPTREVETTELKPGERKCQSKHTGAVAAFTYSRQLPDGKKVDRVFESYYRPLPEICLVGVESDEDKPIPDFIAEDLGITLDVESE